MTTPERPPLSDEERALAARLARLDGHAAPSPALDARILAAARNAPAMSTASRNTPRRRWPAVLGLAASLVLAVGIAWQLRLRPEPAPAPREDRFATMRVVIPPADEAPTTVAGARPTEAKSAAAAAGAGSGARDVAGAASPAVAGAAANAAGTGVPAPAAARMAAKPAVEASAATPTPMPPPPPAPPVVLDTPTPMSLPPAPAAPMSSPPVAAPEPPPQRARNEAQQADMAATATQGDEPDVEVPPATADSPAVRDAWLQRIHGLVDSGDIAGARASLREFVHRYPDYVLPEDLRAFAP